LARDLAAGVFGFFSGAFASYPQAIPVTLCTLSLSGHERKDPATGGGDGGGWLNPDYLRKPIYWLAHLVRTLIFMMAIYL
jgi:hypothetical protein